MYILMYLTLHLILHYHFFPFFSLLLGLCFSLTICILKLGQTCLDDPNKNSAYDRFSVSGYLQKVLLSLYFNMYLYLKVKLFYTKYIYYIYTCNTIYICTI